jgi:hypothetical protein
VRPFLQPAGERISATICVGVQVNDCLVFAADSAVTLSYGVDSNGSEIINVLGHGNKVFNLKMIPAPHRSNLTAQRTRSARRAAGRPATFDLADSPKRRDVASLHRSSSGCTRL